VWLLVDLCIVELVKSIFCTVKMSISCQMKHDSQLRMKHYKRSVKDKGKQTVQLILNDLPREFRGAASNV